MSVVVKLFLSFAKIGLIGFGGGMAIVPLIYQAMLQFNSMDPEEFTELFAISQATPGPLAVNAATFSGLETAGLLGALAATVGVALPSFILTVICVRFLNRYQEHNLVKGAFTGIRPVTVGLILSGMVMIGQSALFTADVAEATGLAQALETIKPIPMLLAAATFVLAKKFKVNAIKLIIIMGLVGAILCS